MKNFNKTIRNSVIFILLMLLTGCSNRVTVKQKIDYLDSKNCYFMSTYVWHCDNNCFLHLGEIVYANYTCVCIDSLNIVKTRELKKAEQVKSKLDQALNN